MRERDFFSLSQFIARLLERKGSPKRSGEKPAGGGGGRAEREIASALGEEEKEGKSNWNHSV